MGEIPIMSEDPAQKPSPGEQIKKWFGKLIEDPISTLVDSGVWIFLFAIGVSIAAMFARMGWDMVKGAWN
jgi:hypothetical protein